jgi:hypothetical protein
MITQEQLKNWFSYHSPVQTAEREGLTLQEVSDRYERIRAAGLVFAEVIVANTPPSADQTAAVRKIREATFTANASIACGVL